eukprot:CAMPEP_0179300932 /NCGR_PEP_ID=MMETSP0797-20121207/47294_1 /TAXON_ID=47934 /ORGANISM="Dinophysis acuminata, Strain DAEP01" /LENGTH=106 /DNA_ID=CAMNT_0021010427 /DNA_START=95 /DNA_END=414 /DNA_ORIENTATION=-
MTSRVFFSKTTSKDPVWSCSRSAASICNHRIPSRIAALSASSDAVAANEFQCSAMASIAAPLKINIANPAETVVPEALGHVTRAAADMQESAVAARRYLTITQTFV